jgi:hypothetical protein
MSRAQANVLDELPGELMIWVLIVSELLFFWPFSTFEWAIRLASPSR